MEDKVMVLAEKNIRSCQNVRKHSANPVFPPLKVLLSFA